MAGYVELGEVRTWYDEKGGGEPLVLMHPGGADARAWAPNIDALAARFHVFTPERRGAALGLFFAVNGPISYELMAQDTIAFLEGVVAGPAHLVGWSAGASVALVVAVRRPDLARRLVLIGVSSTATAGSPPRSIRTRTPPSLSRRATPSARPRVPTTSRWSPRSWRA